MECIMTVVDWEFAFDLYNPMESCSFSSNLTSINKINEIFITKYNKITHVIK